MPMGPLIIRCSTWSLPPDPEKLHIPTYGILEKARAAIRRIPDPSEYIAQMMDNVQLALAPIKQLLELIEAIKAIYDCMMSLPKSILPPDPTQLFQCLKKLAKAIITLFGWVPPLAYIPMALDVLEYLVGVIDEIISLFVDLDKRITGLIALWEEALLYNDLELQISANCGFSEINALVKNIQPLLLLIQPAADVLNEMFIEYIPSESLKKAIKMYQEAQTWNRKAVALLGTGLPLPELPGFTTPVRPQHVKCPLPPMGNLFENLNQARNALVLAHNTVGTIIGRQELHTRTTPAFVNF
ncbi:MAG: hypothetical protein FJ098_00745 [Deltaproteobacteria bacterium]|nr:hypothetical protein [Deltaproteobacteria bacterium]